MDKVYLWSEMQGNQILYNLEPSMLAENGMIRTCKCRPLGTKKRSVSFNQVRYDKGYVLCYIATKLFARLGIENKDFYLQLVSEAWDEYKKA